MLKYYIYLYIERNKMKNKYKILFLVIMMVIVTAFSASCGSSGDSSKFLEIQTPNLDYKDGAYTITLSPENVSVDLSSYFTISEYASYEISKSESFDSIIGSEVTLEDGNNNYFVKVKNKNGGEMVYKFVVIKKKLCTVTFNTNGGSAVQPIQCEDGQFIEAPESLKPGYTLVRWDYDFTKPVTADITISAEWVANKYKVTIDGVEQPIEITFGEVLNIQAPVKVGYKFTGWEYNGSSFDISQKYSFTNDITIKPLFELERYSIDYKDVIIGTNPNQGTYTVEDEFELQNVEWSFSPEDKVIYTFNGWYKDKEFKEPIKKIDKGTTGNIIVYAKWTTEIPETKIETIVTFNAPGFDCNETTQKIVVGDEYTLPDISKPGYNLVGWENSTGTILVQNSGIWVVEEESVSLQPKWDKKVYSITYISNGGINNENNILSYTVTDSFELLEATKEYSTFAGWYADETFETPVVSIAVGTTGDMTLYAKWEEKKYTVTFDTAGGEITQATQDLALGKEYTLIIPVRSGYEFLGWFKENGEEFAQTGTWLLEENISLKAKWERIIYNITYELDGGSFTESPKVTYSVLSTTFTLKTPVKEGKIFLGWSINDGPIVSKMKVTRGSVGDRTYIAHWCDKTSEDGLAYLISNGVAIVVGYDDSVLKIGSDIVIPENYNGYPVVAIANNAFSGYGLELEKMSASSSFFNLFIPKTITRIGANAFIECDDLKVQLYKYNNEGKIKGASDSEIDEWAKTLVVEIGNEQLVDVIKGLRPALGWNKYWLPEN